MKIDWKQHRCTDTWSGFQTCRFGVSWVSKPLATTYRWRHHYHCSGSREMCTAMDVDQERYRSKKRKEKKRGTSSPSGPRNKGTGLVYYCVFKVQSYGNKCGQVIT